MSKFRGPENIDLYSVKACIPTTVSCHTNKKTRMFVLTLYHTILPFNDPEREGFEIHCRKRRNCWEPTSVFSFSYNVFLPLATTEIIIFKMCNLSSANAFNLVHLQISNPDVKPCFTPCIM